MQKKVFRHWTLVFAAILSLAAFATGWTAPAPQATPALVDEMEDFSLVEEHSGFKTSNWSPEGSSWDVVEGNEWRVERTEDGKPGILVYRVENLTGFEMLAIRNSDEATLSFTVSEDGQKWSKIKVKRSGVQDLGGYWFTTTYKATDLKGNYLRFEVGTDRPTWAFRVARVTIFANPPQ